MGNDKTVTFYLNDGTGTNVFYTIKKVTSGNAIGTADFPANPARAGHIFAGWNTVQDGSGTMFTASTVVTDNMTVHAQWLLTPTGNDKTVTFYLNDGTGVPWAVKKVTSGNAIGTANFPDDPTQTGHIFTGWNTKADGKGEPFTASTEVTNNMTVHAQWVLTPTVNEKTVTFYLNDGTGTNVLYTIKVVTSGQAIGTPNFPAPPTRNGGPKFTRWNTASGGTGTAFTAATVVMNNMEVYAQWGKDSEITLNTDAGDGAFSQLSFTISRTGGEEQTVSLTGSGYSNPRWEVDGVLKGNGNSITIKALDYRVGRHRLTLIITKDNRSWSKELKFNVN
jgi:uncharacterized repeat protein (TIGR02543 family)